MLEELWRTGVATRVDLLGEATVTTAEADRYAARCARGAGRARRRLRASCPRAPRSRPTAPGRCRARTCRSRSPPSRRCCAPTRPSWASATPPGACASCCAARASSARTCTSTWSPSTRARRSPTSCSSCSPRRSSATARPPGLVLQAYLRDSPELCERIIDVGAGDAARLPAARAPGQGRLLGPRDRRGAPARLAVAGLRGQGRLRPQLRGAHAPPARGARRRSASPSPRTTCARSPTPSPPTARLGGADERPRAPGAARPRRRPPGRAGHARAARAHLLPGRRPGGRHGLPRAPAAGEHEQRVLPARAGGGRPLDELLAAP